MEYYFVLTKLFQISPATNNVASATEKKIRPRHSFSKEDWQRPARDWLTVHRLQPAPAVGARRSRGIHLEDQLPGQRLGLVVAVLGERHPQLQHGAVTVVADVLDLERSGQLVAPAPIAVDAKPRVAGTDELVPLRVGVEPDLRRRAVRTAELDRPVLREVRRVDAEVDAVLNQRAVVQHDRPVGRSQDDRPALRDVLPGRTGQGQAGDRGDLGLDRQRAQQRDEREQGGTERLHRVLRGKSTQRPLSKRVVRTSVRDVHGMVDASNKIGSCQLPPGDTQGMINCQICQAT